ncbi:MAG: helix-turn-helix domain-containing protein [Candidatus Aureabacteria bacterium]|nr:helix-turn-helix domain-containing protein [Candidatus Auribacterota bacterium]
MGEGREKELMTEKEVRELLRVSRTTLWKLRKNEKFPFSKVGRQYRYSGKEILEWMKDKKGKKIERGGSGHSDNIDRKEENKQQEISKESLQGGDKSVTKEVEGKK